jgi:hypothetical protein
MMKQTANLHNRAFIKYEKQHEIITLKNKIKIK